MASLLTALILPLALQLLGELATPGGGRGGAGMGLGEVGGSAPGSQLSLATRVLQMPPRS